MFKTNCNLNIITEPSIAVPKSFEYAIISERTRCINYVVIYRPPPSARNQLKISTFLSEFEDFMESINTIPGKVLLHGYFNIHYDCPHKPDVSIFINTLVN